MIVRELINLIGFKINESQFRKAEARVGVMRNKMRAFGMQATLFLTAPFIGLNIWLAKTISSFEQLEVSFTTMLGSVEVADELIRDMLNFAAKTPFEIKEIGGVVKQLLAVGIESEKVIPTLKALGDVAAGLSVPVSRLALNYGQIKTQVRLTGRELRDFSIAGVPLLQELADMLGKTSAEVKDMVSAGTIGFDEVEQAFINMSSSGGRFANLMIKQSKTLGGMWSNFKDLITLTAMDFSKDLLPVFKGILLFLIDILDWFKNLTPTMKKTLFTIAALLAVVGPLTLAFLGLVKVGLAVQGMLLAITGAAKVMSLTTLLVMGKFALVGIALAASLGLALLLFEDVLAFMKGQKSLIGEIVKVLSVYNTELKKLSFFSLDEFGKLIGSLSKMFDGFMESLIGTFTGKWKFALQGLENLFISTFKSIVDSGIVILQLFADVINSMFGKDINVRDFLKGNIDKLATELTKGIDPNLIIPTVTGRDVIESAALSANIPRGRSAINQFTVSPDLTINVGSLAPENIEQFTNDISKAVDTAMQRATRNLIDAMPEVE